MGEHLGPGDIPPLRLIDAEHTPQITETGGREQGIAQSVHRDIAVGMTLTSVRIVKEQAQQPTRAAGFDRMHVGAQPHPGQRITHDFSTARARRRSSSVVILKDRASPATVWTGVPRFSTSDASSVPANPPELW